jgi:hypothetical protein
MAATSDRGAQLALAFAARLQVLPSDAWERVALRCGSLDMSTVEGFFGRAELLALSVMLDVDPYKHPLVQPTLAAIGTMAGLVTELVRLVAPPDAAGVERSLARLRERAAAGVTNRPLEAFLAVEAVAERQRGPHPGVAAALGAAGLALMVQEGLPQSRLAMLYSPFEPEIPYSSLSPTSGEHAA